MKKLRRSEVKALARNIRDVRKKSRLSQRAFARAVGVSQQKVSEWERGAGVKQIIIAWRLADVLAQTIAAHARAPAKQ